MNWSPRFDAVKLEGTGFQSFLRYTELNPVRPKLVKRAADWEWSSAAAHAAGDDMDGLLRLDVWRELFGKPERAAEAWVEYVEGPGEEAAANAARTQAAALTFAPYNRPANWSAPAAPEVAIRVVKRRVRPQILAWARPARAVAHFRSDLLRCPQLGSF